VSEPASPGPRHANKRALPVWPPCRRSTRWTWPAAACFEITAEYEAFRLGKEVDGALYREADAQWFRAILTGVVENQKTIDPIIRQSLTEDWPLSQAGFDAARHPARRRL
jgi:N utilization substance protein B